MTQLAYKLQQTPQLSVIDGGKNRSRNSEADLAPTREMIVLSLVLISLQILDGVLTGMGMNFFGIHAEGNFILRNMMHLLGYIPALVLAKTAAILVVCSLCYLSTRVAWLPLAMRGIIVVYLCAAVIPWSYILFSYLV